LPLIQSLNLTGQELPKEIPLQLYLSTAMYSDPGHQNWYGNMMFSGGYHQANFQDPDSKIKPNFQVFALDK